jgi:hypothetical protein
MLDSRERQLAQVRFERVRVLRLALVHLLRLAQGEVG